jgi:hypothetical protein
LPLARRVPKVQIRSDVILVNRKPASYKMFLADTDAGGTCERPSEMLNGSRTFLPVVDAEGGIAFLPVDAIIMMTIPTVWEYRQPAAEGTGPGPREITAELAVDLLDASRISGTIRYPSDEATRIQDFLNQPDRFITLQQGETVAFVNKRHVARISPLPGS